MTRSRISRRLGREKQHTAFWYIAVTALALVAAGFMYYISPSALERDTLCPSKGPNGHVILLVDKTDPLSFTQRQAFEVLIRDIATTKVRAGELLTVFALPEDYKAAATPIFRLCRPDDGQNANPLFQSPEKMRKRFSEKFIGQLDQVAQELQATEPAKYSPIFEMLQLVNITGFRKEAVNGPRRLIVVSDMLHNTPQFSQYRDTRQFSEIESLEYIKQLRADFDGAAVELVYIMHSPGLQTRGHAKFWEDYFNRMNGRLTAVRLLEN